MTKTQAQDPEPVTSDAPAEKTRRESLVPEALRRLIGTKVYGPGALIDQIITSVDLMLGKLADDGHIPETGDRIKDNRVVQAVRELCYWKIRTSTRLGYIPKRLPGKGTQGTSG